MENPISNRIKYLIDLCNYTISTRRNTEYGGDQVDGRLHKKLRASALSFVSQYYGENHPYYKELHDKGSEYAPVVLELLGVLEAISDEIENGWYKSVRGIISAELFSDFVEMANHLLEEGYKDAAAVMLGSTLEEHLRQLARNNEVAIELESKGKLIPKKADTLNSELAKLEIYSKLDQKNITAWLGLRNDAAHGNYENYTSEQVAFLSQALNDFMARTEAKL